MHAIGPRINVFFTHLMTMLFVLVAIASSYSYIQLRSASPLVDLRISEISFLRALPRERCDQAYLKFDLTADFTPMWTWNINHMYVYLVAEYSTDSHLRNEVVVWDSILSGKNHALVKRSSQYNKYSLKDHGYGLRGKDITVKLKYNILPYMGPLFYGEEGQNSFTVPHNYTSKELLGKNPEISAYTPRHHTDRTPFWKSLRQHFRSLQVLLSPTAAGSPVPAERVRRIPLSLSLSVFRMA